MKHRVIVAAATLLLGGGIVCGQATPPSTQYVTREEYEKLKAQLDQVQRQMAAQKQQGGVSQADVDKALEDIEKDIKANHDAIGGLTLGSTNFLVTGYAHADYFAREGNNNTFGAGFNPILLWQLGDRLSIESELEIVLPQGMPEEPDDSISEGEFNLEFADLTYLVNDYVTIGAGKFLTPFGLFPQHLHPAWINKLPDFPLPLDEDTGLVPFQQIGAFVTGGIPIGQNSKIKYDAYISNGPTLRNSDAFAGDAAELGTFSASNNGDLNTNKALGGRIGFLPVPELELDYSILAAEVNPGGSPRARALLQAASVHYKRDVAGLSGTVDLLGEYLWWNMGSQTYDSSGTLGGPFTFSNNRQGGYAQIAYRPSLVSSTIIRKFEGVFRYGLIDEPNSAPGRFDANQFTFGLDYWINPSTVLKAAYEINDVHGGPSENVFMLQAAVGF